MLTEEDVLEGFNLLGIASEEKRKKLLSELSARRGVSGQENPKYRMIGDVCTTELSQGGDNARLE
jgi:hypothetical protein